MCPKAEQVRCLKAIVRTFETVERENSPMRRRSACCKLCVMAATCCTGASVPTVLLLRCEEPNCNANRAGPRNAKYVSDGAVWDLVGSALFPRTIVN